VRGRRSEGSSFRTSSAYDHLFSRRSEQHGHTGESAKPRRETPQAILGASIEFIELDGDAHLRSSAGHAITLAGVIRRIRPGVVMAPSLSENQHPDHAQLGRLVRGTRSNVPGAIRRVSELKELPPHSIKGLFYYALSLEAEPRDLSASSTTSPTRRRLVLGLPRWKP